MHDSTVISVNPGLFWHVMPSMDVVQIAPQSRVLVPRPPQGPALREHTEAVMLDGEKRGFTLRYIGTAPLWSGHRVYAGAENTEWAMMPAEEDPEVQSRYGLAVWRKTIDDLEAMVRAGLDFPAVYTAHQVPAGTVREGEPIQDGVFAPPVCEPTARLSATLGGVAGAGMRVAVVPLIASAAIAAGMVVVGAVAAVGVSAASAAAAASMSAAPMVGTAGRSAASAIAKFDPMLFGAVVAPGRPAVDGELASWFLLAQWNYEDEPQ